MPTNTFFNLTKEKKERVINAALDEFADKGYTNASITNIVNMAEIAKGSFYQYFEGKEDLYKYILKKAVDKEFKYIEKELESFEGEDFFDYWRRLNIAGIKYTQENKKLAKIAADIANEKNKKIYQSIIEKYKDFDEKVFERLLKDAVENGEVRKDINIEYTAHLLYKASFFITDYFYENPDLNQLDEFVPLIDNVINIIEHGIKKEGG